MQRPAWVDALDRASRPAAVPSLGLPAGLRVMVVGPHPDDFDCIGVTLKHLQQAGSVLEVIVVQTGSGVEDSYCSPPTIEHKQVLREREQRASCRFYGLPDESPTFVPLEQDSEAQPVDSDENRRTLAELILPFRPQMVFMPHGSDTNSGHRSMYAMVSSVLSDAGDTVALMLNRDPKTLNMRTDFNMPFGEDEARWKAELLRFHDSQHQRNLNTRGHGFDERILADNKQSARDLGLAEPYAEVFELQWFRGRS